MTLYSEKLKAAADQEEPKPLIAPTGITGIDALTGVINRTTDPFRQAPPSEQGEIGKISNIVNGVLGAAGMFSELLDTGMALAASPLAKLMPGMPATVITAQHIGMPHAHTHPPSSGMPLPSIGATMGAGSVGVLIGGMPAARASDIGVAPTCGSLFPLFEIKTGSSNTFIGGSRAARMLVDSTLHCVPGGPAEKIASKIKRMAEKAKSIAGHAMGVGGVAAQGLSAAAVQTEADATRSKDPEGAAEKSASAAMTAAQAAADAAALGLSLLLGKDPGMPPSRGSLMVGNPTVLIGGIPLPDSFVMLGLLKGLKKLKGKKPAHEKPNLKCDRPGEGQNPKCERPGEPIDPVTGASANEFIDVEDTGPIPFKWERYYYSHWNDQDGPLGYGFRHIFQRELRLLRTRAIYVDQEKREYALPRMEDGRYGGTSAGFELEQLDDTRFVLKHETLGNMGFLRASATDTSARLVGLVLSNVHSTFHYSDKDQLEGITHVRTESNAPSQIRKTSFRYDGHGHIIDIRREDIDRNFVSIARYEYDEAGCLITWHDPLGATGSYAYDGKRRMTQVTDRNGYTFYYKYDGEDRCIASAGQDHLWRVQLKYEPGRTLVTEADGGQWIFHYNEAGTVTRIVDPYGGTNDKVLDPEGRIIKEIDSGGRVMRWLYDEKGRNTARMDRWGNIWPTKDEAPNLPNPLAHEVPSTPLALQWGNVENLPPVESIDVPYAIANLANQVLALPEPVLKEHQVRRDAAGRVIEEVDVYGRKECFAHDPAGNVVLFKDKDGKEYRYATSSWNLRGVETDPLGNSVRYGYTLREKVAVIIDANGNESSYTYDYKDRITSVKRHGVIRETYKYDVGDRLIEKRDGDSNVLLRFEVGENGLHSKRILTSGEVHTYEYDERGNFTNASTEKYDVRMSYDGSGRRTSDLRDGKGVRHRYRGKHLARTEYFDRFVVDYEVCPNGDFLIHTPVGGMHRLQRTAQDSLLMILGNGTRELRCFDSDARCIGRVRWHDSEPEVTDWMRYHYSPVGELRRVEGSADGDRREYCYDAAHRLVSEIRDGWTVRCYKYDAGDNLFTTPTMPWMHYCEGNRLESSSGGTYRYNHRNHLSEVVDASSRVTRYHYNSMDLLVRGTWSDRSETWTAEYDGLCRRIAKAMGQARTEYYWDGDRLAVEVAPDGGMRIYVYANEETFLPFMFLDYDAVDAPPEAGLAYFVFCNQVGLPERIENAQRQEVWRARDIDPYGLIQVAEGNTVEYDLRWPGHWLDRETGLHYNRFRAYSPDLARYIQSDPMGQAGGINLYTYIKNPLSIVDVLGLSHKNTPNNTEANTKSGQTEELVLFSVQEIPCQRPRPPKLSSEEGQRIVDFIQLAESSPNPGNLKKNHGKSSYPPDRKQANSRTIGLTELEDGRVVVTISGKYKGLSPRQRTLARVLLKRKGFNVEDDVIIMDDREHKYCRSKKQQQLQPYEYTSITGKVETCVPNEPWHAEQKGIQAGKEFGSRAVRQWTSSGNEPWNTEMTGHGGAACSSCSPAQTHHNVYSETGVQPKHKSPPYLLSDGKWGGRRDRIDRVIPGENWEIHRERPKILDMKLEDLEKLL